MTTFIASAYLHDQIPQLLEELFSPVTEWFDKDDFIPLYRLGPHASLPVVLAANGVDEGSPNKVAASRPVLRSMKWGVVFEGSDSEQGKYQNREVAGRTLLRLNTRWDGVKMDKRCAVISQGFFIHLRPVKGGRNVPYFVRFKDRRMMLLAGLYDQCTTLEEYPKHLFTFALVTTDPIHSMGFMSDRVPVILSTSGDVHGWLNIVNGEYRADMVNLLTSSHDNNAHELEWFEVSLTGKDSPRFINPVWEHPDGIENALRNQINAAVTSCPSSQVASVRPAPPSQTTMASSSQAAPLTSVPASQGICPTRPRARPKLSGRLAKPARANARKERTSALKQAKINEFF